MNELTKFENPNVKFGLSLITAHFQMPVSQTYILFLCLDVHLSVVNYKYVFSFILFSLKFKF